MKAAGETKRGAVLSAAGRLAAPAGALLLAVAFALWTVLEPSRLTESWPVLVPTALGALLLAGGLIFSGRWLVAAVVRRRTAVGINVAAMVLLAAAALVMVNAISARRAVAWFWTEEEVFDLSANTRNVLQELDAAGHDLRITAVMSADRFTDRVHALLREFERHSDSIRFETLDFHRDAGRVELLARDLKNPITNEVLVLRYGDKERIVDVQDLVHIRPGGFFDTSSAPPRFRGEAAVTSAIKGLIQPGAATIYFTRGHGEFDIEDFQPRGLSELAKRLQRDYYNVDSVNLAEAGAVPEDCSVLAIVAPIRSFSEREVRAIRDYLHNRGGNLLLMPLPRAAMGRITGLREFLYDEYGVNIRDDLLVAEQRGAGGVQGDLQVQVSQWGDHRISADLANLTALFPWSCPVEKVPAQSAPEKPRGESGYLISPLAQSSRHTWGETGTSVESDRDIRRSPHERSGPFSLAVAVEHPEPGGSPETLSRLVVIGNAISATNQVMADEGFAARYVNRSLVLGAIGWLAERDYDVGVEPLQLQERPLDLDRQARRAIRAISWFGAPLALVMVASLVLWRRSR